MSHFEEACAAVQAALDAGARYADARVMVRRSESMTARDGEVEDLASAESAGLGVRALVGSSWGFYAVPDLSDAAARAAGRRAAQIAAASATVPGPPTPGGGGRRGGRRPAPRCRPRRSTWCRPGRARAAGPATAASTRWRCH